MNAPKRPTGDNTRFLTQLDRMVDETPTEAKWVAGTIGSVASFSAVGLFVFLTLKNGALPGVIQSGVLLGFFLSGMFALYIRPVGWLLVLALRLRKKDG